MPSSHHRLEPLPRPALPEPDLAATPSPSPSSSSTRVLDVRSDHHLPDQRPLPPRLNPPPHLLHYYQSRAPPEASVEIPPTNSNRPHTSAALPHRDSSPASTPSLPIWPSAAPTDLLPSSFHLWPENPLHLFHYFHPPFAPPQHCIGAVEHCPPRLDHKEPLPCSTNSPLPRYQSRSAHTTPDLPPSHVRASPKSVATISSAPSTSSFPPLARSTTLFTTPEFLHQILPTSAPVFSLRLTVCPPFDTIKLVGFHISCPVHLRIPTIVSTTKSISSRPIPPLLEYLTFDHHLTITLPSPRCHLRTVAH